MLLTKENKKSWKYEPLVPVLDHWFIAIFLRTGYPIKKAVWLEKNDPPHIGGNKKARIPVYEPECGSVLLCYAVMISLYVPDTHPTWLPIFTACQPFWAVAIHSHSVPSGTAVMRA